MFAGPGVEADPLTTSEELVGRLVEHLKFEGAKAALSVVGSVAALGSPSALVGDVLSGFDALGDGIKGLKEGDVGG